MKPLIHAKDVPRDLLQSPRSRFQSGTVGTETISRPNVKAIACLMDGSCIPITQAITTRSIDLEERGSAPRSISLSEDQSPPLMQRVWRRFSSLSFWFWGLTLDLTLAPLKGGLSPGKGSRFQVIVDDMVTGLDFTFGSQKSRTSVLCSSFILL